MNDIIVSVIGAVSIIVAQAIISGKQQRIQDVKTDSLIDKVQTEIGSVKNDVSDMKAILDRRTDEQNKLIKDVAILRRDVDTSFQKIDELREDFKSLQERK